jgi:murein DD-endopeptidase MepM/ murein hydrolase activator NlpD
MDRCFAGSRSRRVLRWAVLPVLALGAAACSPDTTRFGDIPIGSLFAPPPPGGQMSAPTGEPAMAGAQPSAQPASLQYAAPQTPAPPRLAQPQPPRTAPEATATARPGTPRPLGTPGTAGNWDWEGGTAIIVGPGETIEGIARKHRVPASAIMAANGIANPAAIMAGQRLVIPRYKVNGSGAKLADAAAPRAGPPTHAAQAPGIAVSTLPAAPVAPAVPAAPAAAAAQAPVSLAARAPVAPAAPAAAAAPAIAPATTASIPASVPAWTPVGSAQTLLPVPPVHTVAAGDTLSRIAHQYHVKVSELVVANGLAADTPLKIGEKITVPVKTAPVKGRAVAAAAAAGGAGGAAGAHAGLPPGKTASAEPVASVRMVAADPSAGETSAGGPLSIVPEFRWPIRGRVINNFGAKVSGASNDGIDLAVPEGTPVRAADEGVVAYAGSELKGYGNLVLVRHANGFVTAYANASELMVKRNDQVHKGQVIAKSGQTGTATAPQLHFEIRKNSAPVDPMLYLPADKTASAPL